MSLGNSGLFWLWHTVERCAIFAPSVIVGMNGAELGMAILEKTRLSVWRKNRGLSQSELAKASGVGLKSIQMYEQRINDIDKAQAHTVYRLARAIGCEVEDLLEQPMAIS